MVKEEEGMKKQQFRSLQLEWKLSLQSFEHCFFSNTCVSAFWRPSFGEGLWEIPPTMGIQAATIENQAGSDGMDLLTGSFEGSRSGSKLFCTFEHPWVLPKHICLLKTILCRWWCFWTFQRGTTTFLCILDWTPLFYTTIELQASCKIGRLTLWRISSCRSFHYCFYFQFWRCNLHASRASDTRKGYYYQCHWNYHHLL